MKPPGDIDKDGICDSGSDKVFGVSEVRIARYRIL
jgi:hypothetical protein